MIPAPTNEIAIGMKMMALASDSNRLWSASTAITRPNAMTSVVPMTSHRMLFRKTSRNAGFVKMST